MPLGIALSGGLGLVIRLIWVFAHEGNNAPTGDAYYFHIQGLAMTEGEWFVNPIAYDLADVGIDAAHHPPLYSIFLGALSWIGLDSPLEHRLASALLGAAAVVALGLVARHIAGDRVGAITTFIAAINPNLWINDAQLKSESMYVLLLAGVLWFAFRYREDPSLRQALWLGLMLGLTALTRAEALLAFALIAAPVVVLRPGGWPVWVDGWRTKLTHLVALGAVGLAVMAPWITFNMMRFEEPVTLSYGSAGVIPQANCDETYSGPLYGYWSARCFQLSPELQEGRPDPVTTVRQALLVLGQDVDENAFDSIDQSDPVAVGQAVLDLIGEFDESVIAAEARTVGVEYVRDHARRAPVVALARVGRMYGVFRPVQNLELDEHIEQRGNLPVKTGFVVYLELIPLAVLGAIVLRRQGTTIAPFVGLAIMVTLTAVVAIGLTRYRVPVDLSLCLLGAVGVDALLRRRRPARPSSAST